MALHVSFLSSLCVPLSPHYSLSICAPPVTVQDRLYFLERAGCTVHHRLVADLELLPVPLLFVSHCFLLFILAFLLISIFCRSYTAHSSCYVLCLQWKGTQRCPHPGSRRPVVSKVLESVTHGVPSLDTRTKRCNVHRVGKEN